MVLTAAPDDTEKYGLRGRSLTVLGAILFVAFHLADGRQLWFEITITTGRLCRFTRWASSYSACSAPSASPGASVNMADHADASGPGTP